MLICMNWLSIPVECTDLSQCVFVFETILDRQRQRCLIGSDILSSDCPCCLFTIRSDPPKVISLILENSLCGSGSTEGMISQCACSLNHRHLMGAFGWNRAWSQLDSDEVNFLQA